VYSTRTSRPRLVDAAEFCAALTSSLLCRPDAWTDRDVDGLARLYNTEISMILDRLAPARTVTCRQHSADPWFDDECRQAKRRVRQLERATRRTGATAVSVTEWTAECRAYRALLCRKHEAFWTSKIDSERSSPSQLLALRRYTVGPRPAVTGPRGSRFSPTFRPESGRCPCTDGRRSTPAVRCSRPRRQTAGSSTFSH